MAKTGVTPNAEKNVSGQKDDSTEKIHSFTAYVSKWNLNSKSKETDIQP